MAVEAAEDGCTVNHESGVHGGHGSRQGSTMDEGLHRGARYPARGIPTLLRQSKCHPPCEERGLPLQNEAYPAEVSLDPGASRRTRVRADEDPHDRKWVRHADQGADSRQAASMPKADRIGATFHAGVKGEFVGKHVPPDGR